MRTWMLAAAVCVLVLAAWGTDVGFAQPRLRVGDKLPKVDLPSLHSGAKLSLQLVNGRLTFRRGEEEPVHPNAAVVFFVRY